MGLYFATASKDNTARLWTVERTFPLRIFVGHLMDVDVSSFSFTRQSITLAMIWWNRCILIKHIQIN